MNIQELTIYVNKKVGIFTFPTIYVLFLYYFFRRINCILWKLFFRELKEGLNHLLVSQYYLR